MQRNKKKNRVIFTRTIGLEKGKGTGWDESRSHQVAKILLSRGEGFEKKEEKGRGGEGKKGSVSGRNVIEASGPCNSVLYDRIHFQPLNGSTQRQIFRKISLQRKRGNVIPQDFCQPLVDPRICL